jgi:hypothetical protein
MNLQATHKANPSIALHYSLFEAFGFDILQIHADEDYFQVKINRKISESENVCARIEPLLFNSLEMFSHWLKPLVKGYKPSSCYFINLHPKPLFSDTFLIEIDYLNTSNEVMYLEAYCYDEKERLVGKAGRMLLQS